MSFVEYRGNMWYSCGMVRDEGFPSGIAISCACVAQGVQILSQTHPPASHFTRVKLIHFEAFQWHVSRGAKCPSVCVGSIAPEPFSTERRNGIGGQHYNSINGRKR